MRLLGEELLSFRRQILAVLCGTQSDGSAAGELKLNGNGQDLQLLSLSYGVIRLERWTLEFGGARRRVEITKMRGAAYREGWHDYRIRTGGIEVFPTLVAAEHAIPFVGEPVSNGLAELEALTDGGPLRGTSTLLLVRPARASRLSFCNMPTLLRRAASTVRSTSSTNGAVRCLSAQPSSSWICAPRSRQASVSVRQVDPAQVAPGELGKI
jgi:circadian clock protein KaiC